jgi:hypothetical protein
MAILTDYTFKGIPLKTYLNFTNLTVQKQFNTNTEGNRTKLVTVAVELMFHTQDQVHFLESRPFYFTVDNLDGLTTANIYERIKETHPGEDC